MVAFPTVQVSELVAAREAELKTGPFGTQLRASEYTDGGTPVINVRNIGMGHIRADKLEFISDATRDRLVSHVLRAGDIVFGRKGAVERHVFIRKEQDGWFQGSDCLRLRFKSPRVEPRFASYFFATEEHQRWMMNQCSHGATMASLNQEVLARIALPLPEVAVQRRIVGILSAYDELIENSQRRIRILEMMARALYREWFVHFRFPGHEEIPRVVSPIGDVPRGWEVTPFSALATYLNGYAFKPSDLGAVGKPIIKIKELKAGVTGDTPRNPGTGIPTKFVVRDGDVLFSWSADLDAYLWLEGEGLLNQHLFNVIPVDGISKAFCFHALKESMPRFRALSLGATMHHIKRSALDQIFTCLPPSALRMDFDALVEPMHHQLIALTNQVRNLRRTRDLLLPRLLSGEVLGQPDARSLRERLPRVFQLKDMLSDPLHPDAYFQGFEPSLKDKLKRNEFEKIERQLAVLDDRGWGDLRGRAKVYLQARDATRGWSQLFETVDEAKGFAYLQKLGCAPVKFIPTSTKSGVKTPDLEGLHEERRVLCEVKTINISQKEAESRKRTHEGQMAAKVVETRVDDKFLAKLRSTLEHAAKQLDAQDPKREARRIVFTVVHFDDWVGDYQPEYFNQIDETLTKNPVVGAELVFSPAINLFKHQLTMKSATVFEFA